MKKKETESERIIREKKERLTKRLIEIKSPDYKIPNKWNRLKQIWRLKVFGRLLGVYAVEIKTNGLDIQVEKDVIATLKKRQYTEYLEGWRKGFVRVVITQNGITIGHDIRNGKMITHIGNPLLTLNDWLRYFEKI